MARIYGTSINHAHKARQDAVSQLLVLVNGFFLHPQRLEMAVTLFANVMRHLVGNSVGTAAVTLLGDGELSNMLAEEG